jgi:hypothetical protein
MSGLEYKIEELEHSDNDKEKIRKYKGNRKGDTIRRQNL